MPTVQVPKTVYSRYGGWIPSSRVVHQSFLNKHAELARSPLKTSAAHIPAVEAFSRAIKSDKEMKDLFDQIFLQVDEQCTVKSYEDFLYQLDIILVKPPSFHIAKDSEGNVIGEPIGVPVLLLFDLLTNTTAAYDLFRKPAFNDALKALLDSWGAYLSGPGSNSTLTAEEEGWFSEAAMESLEDKGRGEFNSTYICPNPDQVNRGYQSWDEFFTRRINPSARPILDAGNQNLLISACESTPYAIQENVKMHDQFWLKAQKYSVYDMLGRDEETAKKFIGGTVYQAFLSPQDFHRWHAPIDGVITRAEVLPGTYYAVLPDEGAEEGDPDLKPGDPHGALIRSQGWLTQSSTRAIIYIKADKEDIGLVAFIGVGMAEVSTCTLSVQKDQHVSKGDELGMFHFGGSTHALIFEPKIEFVKEQSVEINKHLKLHSTIAELRPRK